MPKSSSSVKPRLASQMSMRYIIGKEMNNSLKGVVPFVLFEIVMMVLIAAPAKPLRHDEIVLGAFILCILAFIWYVVMVATCMGYYDKHVR